ncbi:SIR2 family NAD-dependent protein deacylase [Flavobacterium sp. FlaQc-28]|uniref:SIR2 family NAD-dependent protein deacylase n=1 Tax=Flavobacterium sp. FlaQc-28 TaxID=3374178 RepID=UPI0037571EB1
MANERIFELIRKEEVLLFAGAGMSIYAGYPSGASLSQIIYDNLSNDIKPDIEFTWNLPKLCDDIFQIKGGNKNFLIEILKREFKKTPKSIETHSTLARIPHFRTIITTNYDTLIESTNQNIEVIRRSTDYANANPKDQLLFKIHSDFTDADKIILTSTDYLNYFSNNSENTIFWNAVKDRLASNHILFIGYSLDDTNVQDMIKKIIDELGAHRKEMFFVAPSLSKVKQAFLNRHNIKHIQSSGEILIKEIEEDIKKNFFPDLAKGIGTADTALNFAKSNQLSVELKKSEVGLDIGKVESLDSNSSYQIDFKVTLSDEKREKFKNFIENKSFEEIDLGTDSIKELTVSMKELVIRNQDSLAKLILKKRPYFQGNINILFDDDFEIDNYPFQITAIKPAENESKLKIIVDEFIILINFYWDPASDKNRFHMEIFPPEKIKSTYSGLQFYQILSRITENQRFKIRHNRKSFFNSSQFPLPFTKDAFQSHTLKEYFKNLKLIEKHFDVTFKEIDSQQMLSENLILILSFINNETIKYDFKSISFEVNKSNRAILMDLKEIDEEREFAIFDNNKTVINLHGHDFDLGYRADIINDPIILNPEILNNKIKNSKIIIGSKSNKIDIKFLTEKIN